MTEDAERLSRGLRKHRQCVTEDSLRDMCDMQTGGDLDCTQLDILVDMVKARLGSTRVCETCKCYGDSQ